VLSKASASSKSAVQDRIVPCDIPETWFHVTTSTIVLGLVGHRETLKKEHQRDMGSALNPVEGNWHMRVRVCVYVCMCMEVVL
jgi:hypothetical protein